MLNYSKPIELDNLVYPQYPIPTLSTSLKSKTIKDTYTVLQTDCQLITIREEETKKVILISSTGESMIQCYA